MKHLMCAALVAVAWVATAMPAAGAQTARDMYNSALAQERAVRDAAS